MKTTSSIPTTALYADEAPGGLIEPPTSPQFHAGVEPEMTLPAAWWNYFTNLFTNTNIQAKADITGILAELNNLLTSLGITPDPLLNNQLATGITDALAAETTARSNADSNLSTAIALKAPIANPAFTGSPTAPTPSAGDNSTRLATTEFVKASMTGLSAISPRISLELYNTSGDKTWVKPVGIKNILVYIIGAGGSGGFGRNDTNNPPGTGGGGGSGAVLVLYRNVESIETIDFSIGAGGVPTASALVQSAPGEATSFGGYIIGGGMGGWGGLYRVGGAGGTVSESGGGADPAYEVLYSQSGESGSAGAMAVGGVSGGGGDNLMYAIDARLNPDMVKSISRSGANGGSSATFSPRSPSSGPLFPEFSGSGDSTLSAACGGGAGGPHVLNALITQLYGGYGGNGCVAIMGFYS